MGRSQRRKALRRQRYTSHGSSSVPGVRANLRWGIGWGLGFATIYSLFVSAMYLLQGPAYVARYGVTLVSIIAAYLFAGLCGGALLGLLRPITRSRVGAALVGIVACGPASLGFLVAMRGGPRHWDVDMVMSSVLTAVLLGGICGYRFWEPPLESELHS